MLSLFNGLILFDGIRIIYHVEQGKYQATILVVSDSTSVVALSSQIYMAAEGNTLTLVDEHLQLQQGDSARM